MQRLLATIRERNLLLFYAGIFNAAGAVACLLLMVWDERQLNGVNIWLKPFKFFVSISLFHFTMAWYLHHLQRPVAVKRYSMMAVAMMAFEMVVIAGQAARGQLSHFNISNPFNGLMFMLMGVAIVILTVWTAGMGLLFWMKPIPENLPAGYWWGIRLGILLFVVFAFEGGLMASRLQHTVGAPDGSAGWPLLNWSYTHGDLRIAHFVGMHALQVLPLLGWWLKRKRVVILISLLYATIALFLFLHALSGKAIP